MAEDPTSDVDWSDYARQYDTMTQYNPAYQRLLAEVVAAVERLPLPSDAHILDLGGGTGQFATGIAQRHPNWHITLADADSAMLAEAERKVHALGLKNVTLVQTDAEKIDETGRTYHVVNIMHALYAMRSRRDPRKPDRVLQGTHRALAPHRGFLALTDVQRRLRYARWALYITWHVLRREGLRAPAIFYHNKAVRAANRRIEERQRTGDFHLLTLREGRALVENAGFLVLEATGNHYRPGVLDRGIDHLFVARAT